MGMVKSGHTDEVAIHLLNDLMISSLKADISTNEEL